VGWTLKSEDVDILNPSMLSKSELSWRMIAFQSAVSPAPGDGCSDDVYFNTIPVQRWITASVIYIRQLTAKRNANSFWLISKVFNPEILFQARAE
jgi:hypothetical protein